MGPRFAPLGERRERDPAAARVVGRRERPHLVHADHRPRSRRLERLVPELVERRRELVFSVEDSDAPAGAAGYIGDDGFDEIYGDYGEIAVTNTGKTVAIWGEGFSYTGPGGSWSTSSADLLAPAES